MKRGLKYVSFFLSLCLMFTLFSGFTNAATIAAVEDIQESIITEEPIAPELMEDATVEYLEEAAFPEIISKEEIAENKYVGRVKDEEKNEYTLVLRNADGSNTLRLFDYPVKYTDATGQQKDISLELEKREDGGYQTAANSIRTTFPQELSDGISLEYEDVAVRMVPVKRSAIATTMQTASLATDSPAVITATADLSTDKQMVTYQYDNQTALEYSLTYTGFKEDIVVEEYTGQTEYTFQLYTNGLTLVEEDGSYYLADETGEIKATIGDIIIFTADERNNTFGSMTYETVEANEEYILTIHVDAEYLKDEKTIYPIRIDPTLEISYDNNGSSGIQDVTINSAAGSSGSSSSLMIGKRETYGMSRVLMQFPGLTEDTSLTANQITSAKVEIRDLMCESAAMQINCHRFNGNDWQESTANWSTVSPHGYNTTIEDSKVISYANGSALTTAHRYSFDITSVAKGWLSGGYSVQKGIMLKAAPEVEVATTYIYKTFASYNRSSNKPSLVVTYNPAISLSATSKQLYVGNTATLTATTYPTGMTVTWTTSNSSVATVNNGKVTAVRAGNATITAKCTDSSGKTYSAYCQIYVTITNGVYRIKNNYSKKYLQAENGGITSSTNVVQSSINENMPDALCQLWKIYYVGSGYYSIRPMHKLDMGLYASMAGNIHLTTLGVSDVAMDITPYARWKIEETAGNYVFKREGQASATLAVAISSTSSGNLCVEAYASNDNGQAWTLEQITDASITEGAILHDTAYGGMDTSAEKYISPGESLSLSDLDLIVAVYSGNSINQSLRWRSNNTSRATVDISTGKITGVSPGPVTITGSKTDNDVVYRVMIHLTVTPISNGTYFIENKRFKTHVDIENQTMSSGTTIHQWEFHGGSSQKWIFTHEGDGYYSIKSANASGSYYLGVKDDSTENEAPVVLRTGTLTNGMKWKIETTTSGAYKITPKTGEANNRVLAVGWAALGFEDDNGIDIEQRDYVEDTNYKDEWIICTYNNAVLLAINDEDGAERHTYFTDTIKNLQTERNKKISVVSTSCYTSCEDSDMINYLQNNSIFIVHTHGMQTGFKLGPSEFLTMDDLSNEDLSNLEFALLLTCETGVGFDPNHISTNTPVNIIERMVCSGAETVIGFNEDTWVSDCNKFAPAVTEKIIIDGYSVQDAIDQISYTFYQKNMAQIAVIAGNTDNSLR